MKTYNISNLLVQDDILKLDLEKLEFDMNFSVCGVPSALTHEPMPHEGFINFSDTDGEMYGDEDVQDDDSENVEEDVFEDRDSYRNANMDDVYYFI